MIIRMLEIIAAGAAKVKKRVEPGDSHLCFLGEGNMWQPHLAAFWGLAMPNKVTVTYLNVEFCGRLCYNRLN
jgi:hypothetical protein